MIIELIGASGAGKTTLAMALAQRYGTDRFTTVDDLIMNRLGLRCVRHPTLKNLVFDFVGLPFFLVGLRRHWRFTTYATLRLVKYAPTRLAKLNYVRSVVRRVGIHELLRRTSPGRTVLVDEGTVLIAYLLFAYSSIEFTRDDLGRFARLVPLPDGVVYLTAPRSVLVARARVRPDPRKELATADPENIRQLIERAVRVFDGLVAQAPWRDRVLQIENVDSQPTRVVATQDAVFRFAQGLRASVEPPEPEVPPRSREA